MAALTWRRWIFYSGMVSLLRENEVQRVVLSCRIFDLGIETALLHQAMRRPHMAVGRHSSVLYFQESEDPTSSSIRRV